MKVFLDLPPLLLALLSVAIGEVIVLEIEEGHLEDHPPVFERLPCPFARTAESGPDLGVLIMLEENCIFGTVKVKVAFGVVEKLVLEGLEGLDPAERKGRKIIESTRKSKKKREERERKNKRECSPVLQQFFVVEDVILLDLREGIRPLQQHSV